MTAKKPIVRPARPVVLGDDGQPLTPAQAAALALPPLSDEACAIVGRIFADIERSRATRDAARSEDTTITYGRAQGGGAA